MARKPRIYYPGAVYHIMLRGNGGQDIFFLNEDRNYFYSLIQEGIKRYDYQIHSFCLMSNHVHLVLRIGKIALSKVMQNLCFRYTRWINSREKKIGHLFQGRYKSILIDIENYLLELVRYVHLNPVRANIVRKIEDYRWSSHRAYIGLEVLPWLTTDWILSHFGEERKLALLRYQQFIQTDDSAFLSSAFKGDNQKDNIILANDDFMKKVALSSSAEIKYGLDLDCLVKLICNYYKVDIACLKDSSRLRFNTKMRALTALLAQEFNVCTLTSVAAFFGRDVSGMIRKIRSMLEDAEVNDELSKLREWVKKSTSQA